MGRLERVRENVRRAYEVSRDSVRAARSKNQQPNGDPGPGPGLAQAPAPALTPQVEAPPPPRPSIDEAVPVSLRIAAAWSWRMIVVGAVGYVLLYLSGRYLILVAPLMIGLLLAGLLAPALRWILKLRVNRSLATLLVLVLGLAAVAGTLTLVVNQFIDGLDDMVESAEQGIADIQNWVQGPPLNMTDADVDNLVNQGTAWVNENTQQLTEAGLSAVTGTVQFLTGFVLSLAATFFFLRDGRRIWTFVVGTLPIRARAPMTYAGDGAWRTLTGYVRATVLVAFIDAVGIGVGLWLLQVPFAVPLAALVFLGAFIPIVGAFVSGTVAVLVALVDAPVPDGGFLEGGGIIKALMVLGLIILVQQIEGNILQPVIMSRAVQIHPLAVIVAVTAGILLGGIIGALVAVPIVAVLNTVIRRLHRYRRLPPPVLETGGIEPVPGPEGSAAVGGGGPAADMGGGAAVDGGGAADGGGEPRQRGGDDLRLGGVPERR